MKLSTQTVLELACAAYRTYGRYVKEVEYKYNEDGSFLYVNYPNKDLIKHALGQYKYLKEEQHLPIAINVTLDDVLESKKIRKHFRRYLFSAVKGQNDFESEVNALLEGETMPLNRIGYIACLPHTYRKEIDRQRIDNALKSCIPSPLAEVGASIFDKDCEILQVSRSNQYDANNVLAIIDNVLVSWMTKHSAQIGPAVVISARVKGVGSNYRSGITETRLNYVKFAQ